MFEPKEIVSEVPTDTAAPTMYVNGTYILGGIVALGLIVLLALAGFERLTSEVVTAIVAITGPAVAGLASIYNRRAS